MRVACLACDTSTGPPLHSAKLHQNMSNGIKPMVGTRLSTDFCFMGDNYITKKVRDVFLAPYVPTGSLYPYQILSNDHKQYGSYGLHMILASGEITT